MSQLADTPNNLPTGKLGENQQLESSESPVQDLQTTAGQVEKNTELSDRVMQLEAQLAEAQQQVQQYQKQNKQLMQQLELSVQTSERQQILIETLRSQLETNQEQVAQLERDCALTQQRYEEQTTKLSQAETICRDLRSRLYRQQRYTLQFKNALEKCLEVTARDRGDGPASSTDKDRDLFAFNKQGFVPKSPAIKPWSATLGLTGPGGDLELDSELPIPAISSSDWPKTADSSTLNNETPTAQQDRLIETQVPSDPAPASAPDTVPEKSEQLEDVEWQASDPWASDVTATEVDRDVPITAIQGPESEEIGEVTSPRQESKISEEIASSNSSENAETLPLLSPTNSPSPLVYPLRPHKKIKSLAAIDLPTFPR